jgi:allantoinase
LTAGSSGSDGRRRRPAPGTAAHVIEIVSGGTIVDEHGSYRADIVIRDGRISAIVEDASESSGERFDATGLHVFPGGVDIHTHLREPSKIEREDFAHGTASAVAGGITTVIEMPQADPLVTDVESFRTKRALAERGSIADFGLYAAAVGQPRAELESLQAEGALAFKAFMCDSSPGYPRLDDAMLLDALEAMRDLDAMLIVHAENNDLLQAGLARLAAAGRVDPLAHAESRPPLVEIEAIRLVVDLAVHAGARLHVAHVSTSAGARIVADARAAGATVTCETCPQYLLLDLGDLARLGPYARCAPAIRSYAEVDELWPLVLDGTVAAVASDHSPYRYEEKDRGAENIFEAALGLNVIQAMLPGVLDEGRHRRGLSLERFASLSASGPARVVGLHPRKGSISVGADADLAVWDVDEEWEISRDQLFSRFPWTPLEGRRVRGCVKATIRRGELVYRDGEVCGSPGSGAFLTTELARQLETV